MRDFFELINEYPWTSLFVALIVNHLLYMVLVTILDIFKITYRYKLQKQKNKKTINPAI